MRICGNNKTMTYEQAINYLIEALKFGINPGLQKIEAICNYLGNPQLRYPTIQITGTNGKSSTTWMTRELLTASGLKTGCYTSPHLHTYRERITIDGEMISENDFASVMVKITPSLEKVKSELGDLTEFEILTAMAFYYFAAKGVDVAVFEVGLGGRWDATSMVQPRVAAITGISLDHTDRLGNTVEEIAWDKAHIIKNGCVAVIGNAPGGALKQIEERCYLVNSPMKLSGRDFMPFDISVVQNEGAKFSIDGIHSRYEDIRLQAFGSYQVFNFTMAVVILEAFTGNQADITLLRSVAGKAFCPGRFELVARDPLVVLDGAHNPEGIKMVVDGLPQSFSYKNLSVILAISADKDAAEMLRLLDKHASLLVLTMNKSYRSLSVDRLTDIAVNLRNRYIIEPDLEKAIKIAVTGASAEDLVCITGSLYTVAEAREILFKAK